MESSLKEKLKYYRLSESEYNLISERLKRPPRGLEWALFSALWSEHCSYKSSKYYLKNFFFTSFHASKASKASVPRVLKSFGENAGVLDIGQGEKVAFKIESHNHPSFIEPFQGAATGVGGILRDVFTMGAKPIALANYLCFGKIQAPRMKELLKGVVEGIASYGNSVGVPTITGQTEFHSSYNDNILVNVLALGLFLPGDKVMTSQASGLGNDIVYVGAKTGRDGLHGASMASESFEDSNQALKSTVQIGDPFLENLLIKSTLEAIQKDLIIAIQDMGAAGLASSSFEMASKGSLGFVIELDKVPLRDLSLGPEEILLSESQERMLLISEPKNFKSLKACFKKWNLDAVKIGKIIKKRVIQLFWKGKEVCKIDPWILTHKAPVYRLPFILSSDKNKKRKATTTTTTTTTTTAAAATATAATAATAAYPSLSSPLPPSLSSSSSVLASGSQAENFAKGFSSHLLKILKNPLACSRSFIYEQFDKGVGGKTVKDARESVAVLRLPHSGRLLGLVLGGRPHVMRFSSYVGGLDSVFYPHLELSSKGFKGLAITDCLNFGNPQDQHIMGEFISCVEAISKMSEALSMPVVSGNVSFYNETKDKKSHITSTPSIGLVGLKDKNEPLPSSFFSREGDDVFLLECPQIEMGGMYDEFKKESENYFSLRDSKDFKEEESSIKNFKDSQDSFLKIKNFSEFSNWIYELIYRFPISSSRVVGKFGVPYALSRMCMGANSSLDLKEVKSRRSSYEESGIGFEAELSCSFFPHPFQEVLYQVILCLPSNESNHFQSALEKVPLKFVKSKRLGQVRGSSLKLNSTIEIPVQILRQAYLDKQYFLKITS